MYVGKVQITFPVEGGDVVFTGPNVITDRVHHWLIDSRHSANTDSLGTQQPIHGVGVVAREEFAVRVGPSIFFGTSNIDIDIDTGIVNIDIEEGRKGEIIDVLKDLGYPQIDSVDGFISAKAKAKSFISCAIGKMGK